MRDARCKMRKKGREMQLRQWKKMRAVRQICERAGERGAEEGIGGKCELRTGDRTMTKGVGWGDAKHWVWSVSSAS